MKDGEDGAIVASRLDRVEIGLDEDGDPISSCVIEQIEGPPPVRIRRAKMSRSVRTMQDAIIEALDAFGTDTLVRGNTVKAVGIERVREEFGRRYVTAEIDPAKVVDAKRKAFKRSLERLPAGFGMGDHDGTELIWRA
jgi:hypothetical protein